MNLDKITRINVNNTHNQKLIINKRQILESLKWFCYHNELFYLLNNKVQIHVSFPYKKDMKRFVCNIIFLNCNKYLYKKTLSSSKFMSYAIFKQKSYYHNNIKFNTHHINMNKNDNRIENIQLINKKQHRIKHLPLYNFEKINLNKFDINQTIFKKNTSISKNNISHNTKFNKTDTNNNIKIILLNTKKYGYDYLKNDVINQVKLCLSELFKDKPFNHNINKRRIRCIIHSKQCKVSVKGVYKGILSKKELNNLINLY